MTPEIFHFVEDRLKMPLMELPLRSTAIALKNKAVVVISPTGNIEQHQKKIDAMGQVEAIVAPNLFHHLFVQKAVELYPNAKVFGANGFAKKRPDIKWDGFLGIDRWPFDEELQLFPIAGMPKFNEFVFLHKASRSLIVTDLCFNLKNMSGIGAFFILSLFGSRNRFAVSRLFAMLVKDKPAFTTSIKKILEADFDRIIMAHGEILAQNAKHVLLEGLAARGFRL
jgi:hypothetical protein